MAATAKTGLGTTITFAASAFSAKIIDIGQIFSLSRAVIEASNMSSTDWMEKIPADLAEGGELTFTIEYDGDVDIPINDAEEDITIDIRGQGTGFLVEGPGLITGASAAVPHNDKMTADITVTWTGAVDMAATSP